MTLKPNKYKGTCESCRVEDVTTFNFPQIGEFPKARVQTLCDACLHLELLDKFESVVDEIADTGLRRATDRAELEAKQYFAGQPEYHCSSCGRNAPPDLPCLMCLEAANGLLPGSLVDAARVNFRPTVGDFVGVGLVVIGFVAAGFSVLVLGGAK